MGRKYVRDNRGRFASVGATGRGGRLKTAGGNRRATQTIKAGRRPAGTISKPKGLKPESRARLKTGLYLNKAREINRRLVKGPDRAEQNIPGRFRGQAGKRLEASIDRAVAEVKAINRARFMKPKEQVRAERAAAKAAKEAAAAAKPKRVRSAQSLRVSRAKGIEKRRSIKIDRLPEPVLARRAQNSSRTQARALDYYKRSKP